MAKIVLVHGMRMQQYDRRVLHARWYHALIRGLRETAWGQAHAQELPANRDVELVYWGDFFRPGDETAATPITKGRVLEHVRDRYYALLRTLVRAADRASLWDQDGRPRGPVAMLVNRLVYQAAVYMNNGPVHNADPNKGSGAFFQIQGRFESALRTDTRIVIAHSLGTVIAYEGLCRNAHRVDTFITVGSPIATPQLILEPLKQRLGRLLNRSPESSLPWPGVKDWSNYYAPADVWCVPVRQLAPAFNASIRDVEVVHGNPHDFVETHKLTTYLKQPVLRNEIARALAATISSDAARSRAVS